MAATREEISRWFDSGVSAGKTHMLVICDTFDYEDYPVYSPAENGEPDPRKHPQNNSENMRRVMECYNLRMDKEAQLNERRANNWDLEPPAAPEPAALSLKDELAKTAADYNRDRDLIRKKADQETARREAEQCKIHVETVLWPSIVSNMRARAEHGDTEYKFFYQRYSAKDLLSLGEEITRDLIEERLVDAGFTYTFAEVEDPVGDGWDSIPRFHKSIVITW